VGRLSAGGEPKIRYLYVRLALTHDGEDVVEFEVTVTEAGRVQRGDSRQDLRLSKSWQRN